MAALKTSRVLLASAVRSEDTASLVQTDLAASMLRFYLDVSDAPGSGGLIVVLRGYDKISANPVQLTSGGAAVTANGTYVYEVSNSVPRDLFGNLMESVAMPAPYQWDAVVKHADAASYTYSLSVEILG